MFGAWPASTTSRRVARIDDVPARCGLATPCSVVDLETVLLRYHTPRASSPSAGCQTHKNAAIQYNIRTNSARGGGEPVALAGPSCDSTDIICERAHYPLPADLEIGDTVDFLRAGAYTASHASAEFNGFPPLSVYRI
jgi:diaminopimelate decarboxylase